MMCEVSTNQLLPLPREGGSRLVRRSLGEGGSETEGFSAEPKRLFARLTEITPPSRQTDPPPLRRGGALIRDLMT